MSSKKMFLSLVPWAVSAVVVNRHGASAATAAAPAPQAYAAQQSDFPAQQRRGERRPVSAATSLTSSGDRSGFISASNEIAGS